LYVINAEPSVDALLPTRKLVQALSGSIEVKRNSIAQMIMQIECVVLLFFIIGNLLWIKIGHMA